MCMRPCLLTAVIVPLVIAVLAAGCTVAPPVPSPTPSSTTTAGPSPTMTVTAGTPSVSPIASTSMPTVSPTVNATTTVTTTPPIIPSSTPVATATATQTYAVTTTTRVTHTIPSTQTTAGTTPSTGTTTATIMTTPSPSETRRGQYMEPQLKYLLLDHYGEDQFFYCDPDYYPISHGDEQEKAIEAFPTIQNDTAEFAAITQRMGLSPPYSDEAKLTVYREHVRLQAIPLTPRANNSYTYTMALGNESDGHRVSGSISTDGTIREESSEKAILTCPICLAAGTLIATPAGPVPVEEIREGTVVWTADACGNQVAAPVVRVSRTRALPGHVVVRVRLADGRSVAASPAHPTADDRPFGTLRAGDHLDGAVIANVERMPYSGNSTYDLLPAGDTGSYWANGVLLGSTLG